MAIESRHRERLDARKESLRAKTKTPCAPSSGQRLCDVADEQEAAVVRPPTLHPTRKMTAAEQTPDKSTSNSTANTERRVRLRRQASIVEYDPDNPFDDVQRVQSGRQERRFSANVEKQSNSAWTRSSEWAARPRRSEPAQASSRRNVQDSESTENSGPRSPRAKVAAEVKSRIRSRPSALVEDAAAHRRRRAQQAEDRARGKEDEKRSVLSNGARGETSVVPRAGVEAKNAMVDRGSRSKASSLELTTSHSPHHALSKETSDALAHLETMLERLKMGSPSRKTRIDSTDTTVELPSSSIRERLLVKSSPAQGTSAPVSRRALSPSKALSSQAQNAEARPGRANGSRFSLISHHENQSLEGSKENGSLRNASRPLQTSSSEGDASRRATRTQSQTESEVTPRSRKSQESKHQFDEMHCERQAVRRSPRNHADSSTRAAKVQQKAISPLQKWPHSNTLFLRGFVILVDIRNQDGDDESEVWVRGLESVGARVLQRPPEDNLPRRQYESSTLMENDWTSGENVDCIVFRNGKPTTLNWYKTQLQGGRAPAIVSVNWASTSLREGKSADMRDFLVEIGKQSVPVKARTSLTSKRREETVNDENEHGNDQKPAAALNPLLVARRKSLTSAPVKPSPLARRCWNMDSSTSSIATNITGTTTRSALLDDQ